ncbi:tripartite tricarboxylate transporter substrate binding protein [Glaciimonas sp. CA11.2]|uniref:Bug family tripartite tricarboxylate transporter substrate binding protein n=1 Tax=unclassified Glaciimonas TaxID=2644401 RepID=UPI002AB4E69B|nr:MULTISPECIES: tripartite tricarboxylate transporter substrate binding protein [unclassified Glaciimonas]MDY7545268.1 tripartite tricarboxylate transporter substrate binding protein [Glaciimonas sp. CA11.2]MEB0011219.1 tripartite tricarboxylate transporter substrate binding protein [Glaciimonas sp. Cout2]MEB0084560.1 tripartite tricarboxylate transporter substrate binding protein [Glaciimonas sp. Gout2]MEB0162729.1 tripartite tricarboxylate transporter substrate binding protein [Glaciimonas s
MVSRRTVIQAAIAGSAAIVFKAASAQTSSWPEANVRIVVPFSVGGASDVLTRLLAAKLQAKLGQSFIVDNRTGAGGNIGMEVVRSAKPDGYTIASATVGTLSINQFLFNKMSYDPAQDFDYVSMIWENCNVFVVAAEHPAKTVQEFLLWARKQPKGVSYGSAGIGTTPHLAGELFRARTGIQAQHIPFRGASQSMPALLAGDTNFAIDNIASYMGLIRAGKVRALAVTSAERWPTLPQVPTMAQVGIPDFVVTSWGTFVMPKGTPAPIVAKLSAALKEIENDPVVKQRFLETGARAIWSSPQDAVAFAQKERVKWKDVVQLSGAKLDS